MKPILPIVPCYMLALFFLMPLISCNSVRESKEQALAPSTSNPDKQKQASYEEFSKMTPEQRWRDATPARRNYLRQNPDLYPYLKPYVLAEPDMEEVPSTPVVNHKPTITKSQTDYVNYTPAQWWDSFSPERKQHIREHPEWFPEFKDFLDKP